MFRHFCFQVFIQTWLQSWKSGPLGPPAKSGMIYAALCVSQRHFSAENFFTSGSVRVYAASFVAKDGTVTCPLDGCTIFICFQS